MRRGFTLIELVVVITIIAIMAGVAGPRMLHEPGGQASKIVREVAGLFHAARREALSRGAPVRLELNTGTGEYRLKLVRQWQEQRDEAESTIATGMLLTTDNAVRMTPPLVEIIFGVDGSVAGDSVIAQGDGETTVIGFDRWTGDPHVHR